MRDPAGTLVCNQSRSYSFTVLSYILTGTPYDWDAPKTGHYDGDTSQTWTRGDYTLYNLLLGSGTGLNRGGPGLSDDFNGANGFTLDDGMWCVSV